MARMRTGPMKGEAVILWDCTARHFIAIIKDHLYMVEPKEIQMSQKEIPEWMKIMRWNLQVPYVLDLDTGFFRKGRR